MTRAALILLLVAGCVTAQTEAVTPPAPVHLRLRACQALPPALPPVVTPERLRERHDVLDRLYRDCAERLRQAVATYDNTTRK